MRHKRIWLGVCLLVLCGTAPVLGVRTHKNQVATTEAPLFGRGEAIDGEFGSGAKRNRSEQAPDWRVTETSYHSLRSFEGDAQSGLSGRTDRMDWSDSGNNIAQDHYVSSQAMNDAAGNRTSSILCADYNLCIDVNPSAPRFGDWQGEIASLDGSYLTTKQFGSGYGGVLLGNSSSANPAAGGLALIPPDPPFSNAVDSNSGSLNSAAAMQSPLTGGRSGVLSVAATGAAIVYQAGGSRVLTDSLVSEDNSGKTDSWPSEGAIVTSRTISPSSIRHTAVSSSSSAGNNSGSTGSDSWYAGNGDVNRGSGSVNDWAPGATFGTTSDGPESSPWPQDLDPVQLFPVVSDDPVPGIDSPAAAIDPPSQVPEPSQIVLMLTVIALVGLVAKRPVDRHGIAASAERAAS